MPYFDNGLVHLYQADAREIPLPDQSVHCVVTSPPYFGLRIYAGNDARGIGGETDVAHYVANLVEVFREVGRVLRDDGVLWLNLGDSYSRDPRKGQHRPGDSGMQEYIYAGGNGTTPVGAGTNGSLLGIPERVVIALQADGWIWRDTVIWAKKTAMPESVNGWRWERCRMKVAPSGHSEKNRGTAVDDWSKETHPSTRKMAQYTDCPGCPKCEPDGLVLRRGSWRCTSSHEYIYMLTKGMKYFCDAEAVKTRVMESSLQRIRQNDGHPVWNGEYDWNSTSSQQTMDFNKMVNPSDANRRSVWNDLSPEPYGGSHFATFPSALPRICIQASTSERGVCPTCGAPWARVVDKAPPNQAGEFGGKYTSDKQSSGGRLAGNRNVMRTAGGDHDNPWLHAKTIGWRPTCAGDSGEPVPATVLDPFAGTGTTCLAAQRLGRRAVGIDLSDAYLQQAIQRLSEAE